MILLSFLHSLAALPAIHILDGIVHMHTFLI